MKGKATAGQRTAHGAGPTGKRTTASALRNANHKPLPSRVAKKRALERLQQDSAEVRAGSLVPVLRRQGYEELPLDEIQDRMSKLRDVLAELVVGRRG